MASKMRRAQVGRGAFPPAARLDVMSMATRKPVTSHCVATRWSLDDLVAALEQQHPWSMSRSSIWRILDEADLKPHRSIYWLNSHDPDFDAKAKAICGLYVQSPTLYRHGRVGHLHRREDGHADSAAQAPDPPLACPGHPERREHEYIRHGTRAQIASFVVPTGRVVWDLGQTRTVPRLPRRPPAAWGEAVPGLALGSPGWWIT